MSSPAEVRVRIGRLVLDGFEDLDQAGQRRLRAAVERQLAFELQQTLRGGAGSPTRSGPVPPVRIQTSHPAAAGAAIAGSIHDSIVGSLNGAPTRRKAPR